MKCNGCYKLKLGLSSLMNTYTSAKQIKSTVQEILRMLPFKSRKSLSLNQLGSTYRKIDPGYPKALVKCWAISTGLGLCPGQWFDQDIQKIWSHSTRGAIALPAGVQQESSVEGGRKGLLTVLLSCCYLCFPLIHKPRQQLLSLWGKQCLVVPLPVVDPEK